MDWWALDAEATYAALDARRSGLDADEVALRLERFGPNRLGSPERARALPIVLHQFKSPLIYILLAAMAISLAIAHWEDAIVIVLVLVLNAVIGFVQEYRAENAIAALMRMVSRVTSSPSPGTESTTRRPSSRRTWARRWGGSAPTSPRRPARSS